jgi:lipooligosaccharide transport system permease protein
MLAIAAATRFSAIRSSTVLERNFRALRSSPLFLVLLLSGLAEPLLYLLSIGVGVGRIIGGGIAYDHHIYPYPQFVAPALLAMSAMTGAIATSTFAFYVKLNYSKVFDAIFVTPVRAFEIAVAELAWATAHITVLSAAFLVIMTAMGLTTPLNALIALPAAILIGLSFAAVGMGLSTAIRSWQDFDMITTAEIALLLFSGAFAPIGNYPGAFQLLVELTPLYHGIELLRGLLLGSYHSSLIGHVAYLLALLIAGLLLARRQIERKLRQ